MLPFAKTLLSGDMFAASPPTQWPNVKKLVAFEALLLSHFLQLLLVSGITQKPLRRAIQGCQTHEGCSCVEGGISVKVNFDCLSFSLSQIFNIPNISQIFIFLERRLLRLLYDIQTLCVL